MKFEKNELLPSEFEALLATIRRDYRAQSEKSKNDLINRDFHRWNARMCIRLLELLNPKQLTEKITGDYLSSQMEDRTQNCAVTLP